MTRIALPTALPRYSVLATLALLMSACAPTGSLNSTEQTITVEGGVTVRGNEPFTDLFLVNDQRNSYVLRLADDESSKMQSAAPGRFRVTGRLYKGDWNGLPYAFIEVTDWTRL